MLRKWLNDGGMKEIGISSLRQDGKFTTRRKHTRVIQSTEISLILPYETSIVARMGPSTLQRYGSLGRVALTDKLKQSPQPHGLSTLRPTRA